MQECGIQNDHAALDHGQTIGKVKHTHQKLMKQTLKIKVTADAPQWHRYVNITVMVHNTTHHHSINSAATETFI